MSIVTISRGSFSRGKEVAEKLSRALNYECISREILLDASELFNIPELKLVRAIHDAPTILDRFTSGKERFAAFFRATLLTRLQRDNVVFHGLAGHFFFQRTAHPRIANLSPNPDAVDPVLVETESECPHLKIIRIDGPLFFGSVNHVSEVLHNIDKRSTRKRNVLIVGCGINLIDVAGAEMLSREAQRRRVQRGSLALCEIKPDIRRVLERGGYLKIIGRDQLFATQRDAVENILSRIDPAVCRKCTTPLFKQCAAAARQSTGMQPGRVVEDPDPT